jgi:hypothetical protein
VFAKLVISDVVLAEKQSWREVTTRASCRVL